MGDKESSFQNVFWHRAWREPNLQFSMQSCNSAQSRGSWHTHMWPDKLQELHCILHLSTSGCRRALRHHTISIREDKRTITIAWDAFCSVFDLESQGRQSKICNPLLFQAQDCIIIYLRAVVSIKNLLIN